MRFLRRWGELIGYPRDFGICDADDSKKLVTECIEDLKIDQKQFPVKKAETPTRSGYITT